MKLFKGFFIGMVLVLFAMPVLAVDNGCDNPDNDMIVAELALCSTHAYNIGATKNPTGADKGYMRDVVAMKTTLITQQMYKQYEQMESMLRRLKTQLEKAVLTTSLEAKGATGSGTTAVSNSYKSNNRNIYMAGVRDCNNELSTVKVFECLRENMTTIYNVSRNGAEVSADLAKQLEQDYTVMLNAWVDQKNKPSNLTDNGVDCKDDTKIRNKTNFQKCLDLLSANIRKGYEEAQRAQGQKKSNM